MITSIRLRCKQLAIAAACFLLVISSIVPVHAASVSGETGQVSWKLDSGVLIISGRGEMGNYDASNYAPWYEYREDIVEVVIEEGVKTIGEASFYNCTNLKTVKMSNSVTQIKAVAFLDCFKLENINLSNKLTYIGNSAFKSCQSLKSISLPKSLKTIEYEAFFDCRSLMNITIPNSVTYLGSGIFSYCDNLLQANIDANVESLPSWTFYDCESLVDVTLSDSIEKVGDNSFHNCENLNSVYSNLSDEERKEINKQVNNKVSDSSNNNHSTTLDSTTNDSISSEVVNNENVEINGTMTENGNKIDAVIDVTVKNDKGWNSIIEKVENYQKGDQFFNKEVDVTVQINLSENQSVSGDLLNDLAGKDVQLLVKGDVNLKIDCNRLSVDKNYSDFSFGYKLEKLENPGKNIINVIGKSTGYFLKLYGYSDFEVTIRIPFGTDLAHNTVSLYQKDGSGYNLIQSVQLDDEGYASFYLSSFDSFTTYLIGLNVDSDNVLIPEELYGDYGYLMDEHGNKYEITGVKSKWGIDITQLTWIVVGILVLVIGLVGGVMFMMFKRRQANEKIRKEVMSEGYSKEENIKKYKPTKKWFEKKKK